jgi:hypothetical protein
VSVQVAAPVRQLEVAGIAANGPRVQARAPARAAWEVSFVPAGPPGQLLATVGAGRATVAVCPAPDGREEPPPERVMLVVDRSRSVGPAGVVTERDLARAILEALPPSVRFNAVLFDRTAHSLFPLARAATVEALGALDGELGPGQLQNGTDLSAALRFAGGLSRAEEAARTWLVIVTDGALAETETGAGLVAAAAGLPTGTRALVLLVRPGGDEPADPGALTALRALPAHFGGVVRASDGTGLPALAAETVAAARRGGDLFNVSMSMSTSTTAGQPVEVFPTLARDGSAPAARTIVWKAPPPRKGSLRHAGGTEVLPVWSATAPWRAAPARAAFQGRGAGLSAWVEPGPVEATATIDEVTRGQMDRQVVHNALALAYLPRARACYLGRRVKGAADFELRGRLRLELTLERGEMQEAVVRASTLHRPEIEACLREAAFGLEVPRPLHRDAPVIAALNLQFQPSTPPAGSAAPDGSTLGREIDLLVGPPAPGDPLELLEPRTP